MTQPDDNLFRVGSQKSYTEWRARKLANYPASVVELMVPIANLTQVEASEHVAILNACRRANLAVFTTGSAAIDKSDIRQFGQKLGLNRLDSNLYADEDGITALQVSEIDRKRDYIPYTNRRLNWHTDGYYNSSEQQIKAFLMFCVRDAAEGGDNYLLDHEIAYILLRDADPRFIEALMHPQAMTIPANIEQGVEIRPAEAGPVFFQDNVTGNLHMRYSARTRNIHWRDDPMTQAAAEFLQNLWGVGNSYIYHHRLMPGQGLICNNVLHSRTAFQDNQATGQSRLMYRARYYDRIAGTDFAELFGDQVSV